MPYHPPRRAPEDRITVITACEGDAADLRVSGLVSASASSESRSISIVANLEFGPTLTLTRRLDS
jgi:hypothetical protein